MAKIVRYKIRAVKKGKPVIRRTFKVQSEALQRVRNLLRNGRFVKINRTVERVPEFKIIQNEDWGIDLHDPWTEAPKPVNVVFIHTTVTKQLEEDASVTVEKGQMRAVDQIAHARGFNGISYSMCIPPSGRIYEGRGFGIVEAAQEGFNTTADSIATLGNTDVFNPTEDQINSIVRLINWGQKLGFFTQKVDVKGHRSVAPKSCPGAKFPDTLLAEIQRRVNG